MKTLKRAPAAIVTAASALALAACGAGGLPTQDGRGDHGTPGEALQVETGVNYYPACGNEVLQWEGPAWYPFTPSNPEDFPEEPIPDWAQGAGMPDAGVTTVALVPAVVAPGPGDDVGTLVIYEGALAYWESDSGELATWLTRDEIEYAWVC
ncbi:hypothetical protein [Demequina sp. NBRC 110052]|uniref:hypothetical protein n=1 Tax=Demequina sp. NBRC 110052 TaxID=1570341 RepID=UPI0011803CC9|nr:hypothetical protein [Demequina sp. NBRC 110052]